MISNEEVRELVWPATPKKFTAVSPDTQHTGAAKVAGRALADDRETFRQDVPSGGGQDEAGGVAPV